MSKKFNKPMTLGLLLIVAALIFAGYNYYEDFSALRSAGNTLSQLADAMPKEIYPSKDRKYVEPQELNEGRKMPTITKNGYEYIGTIEIPKFNIKLPVMAQWDYNRLKKAPCHYSGSYFTNDLVICAHNYRSHFQSLWRIIPDTDIYFISMDGYRYHYITDNIETLRPFEVERMISADNWDLTLFTCYTGGRTRCVVRCKLIED